MSLSWAIVNVSGARAKPMLVYESLARSRFRPEPAIDPWSNAVGGRSYTGCQAVSAGMRGSRPAVTRAR